MAKRETEMTQLARDFAEGMTDKDRVAFGVEVILGVGERGKHTWLREAEDAIARYRFAFEDEATAEFNAAFSDPSDEGEG